MIAEKIEYVAALLAIATDDTRACPKFNAMLRGRLNAAAAQVRAMEACGQAAAPEACA